MKPFDINTDNVIEYLESMENEIVNKLLDDLFSSDDLEERMDICSDILTELELTMDDEDLESDWYSDLEDELKDIVYLTFSSDLCIVKQLKPLYYERFI